ncbi:MAG: hypothetical protein AAB478_04210 [Patescibacteria group bacterium]
MLTYYRSNVKPMGCSLRLKSGIRRGIPADKDEEKKEKRESREGEEEEIIGCCLFFIRLSPPYGRYTI